jgi:hypothetical protein
MKRKSRNLNSATYLRIGLRRSSDMRNPACPMHRLIDIEGMKARRIKARQPHISYDDECKWIIRVLKSVRQFLVFALGANMWLELDWTGRIARHRNLNTPWSSAAFKPTGVSYDDKRNTAGCYPGRYPDVNST